jgi:ATP-dependent exoDNAse (exonuclease V) alpha subunit
MGFRPTGRWLSRPGSPIERLDEHAVVGTVVSRLAATRSAWNAPDLRGEIEIQLAKAGVVVSRPVRGELAERLTTLAVEASTPLLAGSNTPEHIRSLTSPRVLEIERCLTTRLTTRALQPSFPGRAPRFERFDEAQRAVLAAISGNAQLLIVEGAAGAGKTSTLAAARTITEDRGRRLVVVTPTRKASQVAERELGTRASSAAWLIHQHCYRWDDVGHWTRELAVQPQPGARLRRGDVLVIDEAGMLDQDVALALVTIADEAQARLVLLGDRHQLPAVGRGGVLDLAVDIAPPEARLSLDVIHRFEDPEYAELSLLMRRGERPGEVFDRLLARGEIRIHATEVERVHALALSDGLVIADSREQVDTLNAAIRTRRLINGELHNSGRTVTTGHGEDLAVGDQVITRRNDWQLGVANREAWWVRAVNPDGSLRVGRYGGDTTLPSSYVQRFVDLGYATTAHGAQGHTVEKAHLALSEHSSAALAYVGMTRGRTHNTAHLVADSTDQAREQWVATFQRDRSDLGPAHARQVAAEDIQRFGLSAGPGSLIRGPCAPRSAMDAMDDWTRSASDR